MFPPSTVFSCQRSSYRDKSLVSLLHICCNMIKYLPGSNLTGGGVLWLTVGGDTDQSVYSQEAESGQEVDPNYKTSRQAPAVSTS